MTRGRKPGVFDEIHGRGALARCPQCSMSRRLATRVLPAQFHISRQRMAHIAPTRHKTAGVASGSVHLRSTGISNGRRYPTEVRAIAREIQRQGIKVERYRLLRQNGKLGFTLKKTLLIKGVLCHIHCGKARKTSPTAREYVQFQIGGKTKEAKAAVFACWWRGKLKLYVVPLRDLKTFSMLWLPADGRYVENHNRKPKREWTVYEGAWHLLRRERAARSRR